LLGIAAGVRRVVEWSFTKRFRRYVEPHFEPGSPEAGSG
jgi:hypothetical protein